MGHRCCHCKVILNGAMICTSGCTVKPGTGKAFEFYSTPRSSAQLIIQPSGSISITSGSDSIEISTWNQTPNTSFTGRIYVTRIPSTGGSISLSFINQTNRWLTISTKNPAKSNAFDGCCWELINGNVASLVGYS